MEVQEARGSSAVILTSTRSHLPLYRVVHLKTSEDGSMGKCTKAGVLRHDGMSESRFQIDEYMSTLLTN